MVLSNGTKSARYQTSICNRTNVCGGVKKAGLAPSIGWFLDSNVHRIGAVNTLYGLKCVASTTIQTQKYGYRATLGR